MYKLLSVAERKVEEDKTHSLIIISISIAKRRIIVIIMAAFSSISSSPFSLSMSIPSSRSNSLSFSTSISKNPSSSPQFLKLPQQQRKRGMVVMMSLEAGVGVMATKLGMMSFFQPNGEVVPVTVVGFKEGNIVTQIKTDATDGYNAVQVGYRRVRDRKLTKPEMGHLEKAGAIPMRHLQEFRLQSVEGFQVNQRLVFDELFNEGDLVDVSGTTIGKGFQGMEWNEYNKQTNTILVYYFLLFLFLLNAS
jgi:large subunit ribosomal protein L3